MGVHTLRPRGWPANISVVYTTREGGCSHPPYDSLNLGAHVGDDPARVAENRAQLLAALPGGAQISWLNQVHGSRVVEIKAAAETGDNNLSATPPAADASWTCQSGIALAIMTADCLPVLLSDESGAVIAAVHAGWRGLAAGVIEAAINAMPRSGGLLHAWIGPAIGADAFEVGSDVRDSFLRSCENGEAHAGTRAAVEACFRPSPGARGRYLADLTALAGLRLKAMGVSSIQGADLCSFTNAEKFFSYRRDGVTGRMACLIIRHSSALSA